MEEVRTLKDYETPEPPPVLILGRHMEKRKVEFSVYNFLTDKFDQAFLGYPVFFVMPNMQHSAKVFMSASEFGARVADILENLPECICEISFHEDRIFASFLNPALPAQDVSLFSMPVMGRA